MLVLTVPEKTRPVRMRPRKLSRSSKVTRNLNGPSGSADGAGTWLTMVSNKRRQIAFAHVVGQPGIAVAARGVEHREIELLVIGFEQHEQVEHFVEHFRARARRGGRSC